MKTQDWRSEWPKSPQSEYVHVGKSPADLNVELTVSGSKSFTNRALIFAASAKGSSRLTGLLKSDDSFWCMDVLEQLGISFHFEQETLVMHGSNAEWPVKRGNLYIGSAGTTARFLPGVLASAQAGEWILHGSEQLTNRPVAPIVDYLTSIGANIQSIHNDARLPLKITAQGGLVGGRLTVSGKESSQYLSGLLIASALAMNPVEIDVQDDIVQADYVRITLELMQKFGAHVEFDDNLRHFYVNPGGYVGSHVTLEADASTAGYFLSLAALNNGRVKICNLAPSTNQPDVLLTDVLKKMGCQVRVDGASIEVCGPEVLRGNLILDLKKMSDQALTVAVLAVFADGPVSVRNVSHIRKHESDRIRVVCTELNRLGIQTEEYDDGFKVYPGTPSSGIINTYDDHRVAMAFSLIGAKTGSITLQNPGCVAKTCPTYFAELSRLGLPIDFE